MHPENKLNIVQNAVEVYYPTKTLHLKQLCFSDAQSSKVIFFFLKYKINAKPLPRAIILFGLKYSKGFFSLEIQGVYQPYLLSWILKNLF